MEEKSFLFISLLVHEARKQKPSLDALFSHTLPLKFSINWSFYLAFVSTLSAKQPTIYLSPTILAIDVRRLAHAPPFSLLIYIYIYCVRVCVFCVVNVGVTAVCVYSSGLLLILKMVLASKIWKETSRFLPCKTKASLQRTCSNVTCCLTATRSFAWPVFIDVHTHFCLLNH